MYILEGDWVKRIFKNFKEHVFQKGMGFPFNHPYPNIGTLKPPITMKKIKIIEKTSRLAKGVTEDGTLVWFSKQNSSWYDYQISSRNVGDEFEAKINTSEAGNAYVERLTADKFINEIKIENIMLQRDLFNKQIASL